MRTSLAPTSFTNFGSAVALCWLLAACSGGGSGSTTGGTTARGSINGLVVATATNTPLVATIAVNDPPRTVTTGADGRFALADLPTGQRTLTVTCAGYTPRTSNVAIVAGTVATVNLTLDLAATAAAAQVTFTADSRLWRIGTTAGSTPEDLTTRFDQLATLPGQHFGPISVSRDGAFYVFRSERFDAGSQGYAGLTIAPADLSRADTVVIDGATVHGEGLAQATSGGTTIVYVDAGGPHARDIFAVRRVGTAWTGPFLLTGASPFAFHELPVLTVDQLSVVFQAGEQPYGVEGTRICRVGLDGSGFTTLVDPAVTPPGYNPASAVRAPCPAPDGSLVFEAEWSGAEQIWRLPVTGGTPVLVGTFTNDNSPSVLPDGRIASLWLEAPGANGLHQLKVMDANGGNAIVLTLGASFTEVNDIGLGAGPRL